MTTLDVASIADSGPFTFGETADLSGMENKRQQYYEPEFTVEGVFKAATPPTSPAQEEAVT